MTTRNSAPATAFDRVRAVADAVLYEGYLLYPYRSSSGKNRVRWQFGVLAPRRWIEAHGPAADTVAGSAESWWQQTECLAEAPDSAVLHLRLRFLQLQARTVHAARPDGTSSVVDRLDIRGLTLLPFDEAVPHKADMALSVEELRAGQRTVTVRAPGGERLEAVYDDQGTVVGEVRRVRRPVTVRLRLSATPAGTPFPLLRLRLRVENTVPDTSPDAPREEALRRSLVATHMMLALDTGAFVSLLDPPAWAAEAAKACANVRTFPVLGGDPGSRDLVLSAPIILYDHPQIAPESPGDLHDATEIDEILSLRTLTLTDAEKQEARATDPRARAIVDRVDAMPPEMMRRLHGAVRSVPPETETGVVDGVTVARGSRVRLRPRRRGTDAHDMFLAGRTAQVEAVLVDVDGRRHVAVTIEDDPTAELHRWYGRFHYFAPEELVPLPQEATAP